MDFPTGWLTKISTSRRTRTSKRTIGLLHGFLARTRLLHALLVAVFSAAPAARAEMDHHVAGKGSPVIILEAGLGDDLSTWNGIFDDAAKLSTTFAYSRSGYSKSPSSDTRRSSSFIVGDLRNLLQRENLAPPYILVGHGLGGIFMQTFARQHPQEVSAVILLDAPVAEMDKTISGNEQQSELPLLTRLLAPAGLKQEYGARRMSFLEMEAAARFPNVPLYVVMSDKTVQSDAGKLRDDWIAAQEKLAKQSNLGEFIIAKKSRHYIHHDRPELVLEIIRKAMETHVDPGSLDP